MTFPEETKNRNGDQRGFFGKFFGLIISLWKEPLSCLTDFIPSGSGKNLIGQRRSKLKTLLEFLRRYRRLPNPEEIKG